MQRPRPSFVPQSVYLTQAQSLLLSVAFAILYFSFALCMKRKNDFLARSVYGRLKIYTVSQSHYKFSMFQVADVSEAILK